MREEVQKELAAVRTDVQKDPPWPDVQKDWPRARTFRRIWPVSVEDVQKSVVGMRQDFDQSLVALRKDVHDSDAATRLDVNQNLGLDASGLHT